MSDWTFYYFFFNDHCSLEYLLHPEYDDYEKVAIGFMIYNLICKTIFDNYFFFEFVNCALGLFLLCCFFRANKINNLPLALMLFFCLEGYIIMCNLMRNSIAMFLCLNALTYIRTKEVVKYYVLVLLGCTFHSSALLFIPMYFFLNLKLNRWIFLLLVLCANVIYIKRFSVTLAILSLFMHGDNIITLMIQQYTEHFSNQASGITFGYLEKLLTTLLVFLYYDKLTSIREDGHIYVNAIMMYLVIFLTFSEFGELAKRISTLFYFGYWIVWYDMMKVFSIENNRRLFCTFVGLFCVFRIMSGCKYADYEYDNVLFGIKSDTERWAIHEKISEDYEIIK